MSVLWLNGPFGVGKTATAKELKRLLPSAVMFDPEIPGWIIKRTIGRLKPGDYQETWAWETLVTAGTLVAWRFCDPVIVPMSVLSPARMSRLLASLRRRHVVVQHIVLDASADILGERVRDDRVDPAARGWRERSAPVYFANRDALLHLGSVVDTCGSSARDVGYAIARDLIASGS